MTHYEFALAFDPIDAKILKRNFTVAEMEADLQGLSDIDRDYDNHMKWYLRTDRKCRKCFEDNGELLRDVCRAAYPSISREDEDAALGRVYARLDEYQGTSRSFIKWAIQQVKIDAQRLQAFHQLQADTRLFALKAIWSALDGCGDLDLDRKITIPQIMAALWTKVWDEIDSYLEPGHPAALSTRIFAKAEWQAKDWRHSQIRSRQKYRKVGAFRQKQKAEHDEDHKPERVPRRPGLAAIESRPAPEVPLPDFGEVELEPVETASDAEPEASNAPAAGHYRLTALFCSKCGTLNTVNAIENDRARLACGHDRSTEWLPAAKDAWSAEQARLRTENKKKRMEKRAA